MCNKIKSFTAIAKLIEMSFFHIVPRIGPNVGRTLKNKK